MCFCLVYLVGLGLSLVHTILLSVLSNFSMSTFELSHFQRVSKKARNGLIGLLNIMFIFSLCKSMNLSVWNTCIL
jgi:hypothetical protein